MKIARINYQDQPRYAIVEDDSYNLIEGDVFSYPKPSGKRIALDKATLLAPVDPPQIVCIGANYRKHIEECDAVTPKAPLVFIKTCNTITSTEMPIVLPKVAPDEVDYEAELAIIIGRKAKNISENEVDDYIFGYTCANDISARDCQLRHDLQWARGKSFDTFAPFGPWTVTGIDPSDLEIRLTLNGKIMQNSRTSKMIFSYRYLVSYLSQCMTLYPGSIILTGTPEGVGMSCKPPVFLRSGDSVTVSIAGIGELTNNVCLEQ